MSRPIDDYMTVGEAAYKWGLSMETVKNRLKQSTQRKQRKNRTPG